MTLDQLTLLQIIQDLSLYIYLATGGIFVFVFVAWIATNIVAFFTRTKL